jgi:predicted GNAT family N-acyltransferase
MSGATASPALALVDELCARVLERSESLSFGEIVSPIDLEAAFRLRFRAVVEQGWGEPTDFPDGLERDGYDAAALHLGGWEGGRLIATARLVFPAPGRLLPTEAAFDLRVEPKGRVVDFGRLVVEKAYRGASHRVLTGVLSAAWIAIRARGFFHFCAIDTAAMIRLYRRMGFVVEELASPRPYWGEDRYPVRFDLAASAAALVERWS